MKTTHLCVEINGKARISPLNAPIVDFEVWYAEISLSGGYGKLNVSKRDWITAYDMENLAQSWSTEVWFTSGSLPETAGEVLICLGSITWNLPLKRGLLPFRARRRTHSLLKMSCSPLPHPLPYKIPSFRYFFSSLATFSHIFP